MYCIWKIEADAKQKIQKIILKVRNKSTRILSNVIRVTKENI
jgi:hypothetical protein